MQQYVIWKDQLIKNQIESDMTRMQPQTYCPQHVTLTGSFFIDSNINISKWINVGSNSNSET